MFMLPMTCQFSMTWPNVAFNKFAQHAYCKYTCGMNSILIKIV